MELNETIEKNKLDLEKSHEKVATMEARIKVKIINLEFFNVWYKYSVLLCFIFNVGISRVWGRCRISFKFCCD